MAEAHHGRGRVCWRTASTSRGHRRDLRWPLLPGPCSLAPAPWPLLPRSCSLLSPPRACDHCRREPRGGCRRRRSLLCRWGLSSPKGSSPRGSNRLACAATSRALRPRVRCDLACAATSLADLRAALQSAEEASRGGESRRSRRCGARRSEESGGEDSGGEESGGEESGGEESGGEESGGEESGGEESGGEESGGEEESSA